MVSIEQFKDIEVVDIDNRYSRNWRAWEGEMPAVYRKPHRRDFYLTKFEEFARCMEVASADGHRIEFGVHDATSLNFLAEMWSQYIWTGFDTFEGTDEWWDWGPKAGSMRVFKTDVPEVPPNARLVIGLFQDTLDGWMEDNEGPISFINFDSDTYKSTLYCLETLNERIVPGSILRFDELADWRHLGFSDENKLFPPIRYTNWRQGEWAALCDWIDRHGREVRPLFRNWYQSATVEVVQ